MADMIKYQDFALKVDTFLKNNQAWKGKYFKYADDIIENLDDLKMARRTFRQKPPLYSYFTIGSIVKGSLNFNLRYLGQSVGDVIVKKNGSSMKPSLNVCTKQLRTNGCYFQMNHSAEGQEPTSQISVDWNSSTAKKFRHEFHAATTNPDALPRQIEHMYESLLFTEFEKHYAKGKTLTHIQPVSFATMKNTRIHMKTAVKASDAKSGNAQNVTISSAGGEIDLFCRTKKGNRSFLNIIEIKDKNEKSETFDKAMYQAISYAVFIRALIRSDSGEKWLSIWGMEHQPWRNGFTLNAVVAMPAGATDDLSFAGKQIILGDDKIELHYIAFAQKADPSSTGLSFQTSLSPKENL